MPIKRHIVLTALVTGLLFTAGPAVASDHGEKVFRAACATCHVESMSAEAADHADGLLAPPMNLLSTIVRKKTGNTRDAFVRHVIDFAQQPAVDKVKAMPQAVDRFGLMPPISQTYPDMTKGDLNAVAEWLFSHYDYPKELGELRAHRANEASQDAPPQDDDH